MECVKWFRNGCGVFIGSGILVFDSEASAAGAALLPGPTVLGWQVEVESPMPHGSSFDKGSELYLWGLPPWAVEEDVRRYYANAGLARLKFKMNADYSTSVGVAFAGFENREAAMKALELGPPELRGVKCCVKPSGYQGEREVCIRGSDNLTDAVLREQYKAFGADGILSIQWLRGAHDPSSPPCHAFVCFRTVRMASQALMWGDFMVGDEVMEVFQTGKKFTVLDKKGPASDAGTAALPVPALGPTNTYTLHHPPPLPPSTSSASPYKQPRPGRTSSPEDSSSTKFVIVKVITDVREESKSTSAAVPDTAVPPMPGTAPTPSLSGTRITPPSCAATSPPLSATSPSPYEEAVHFSAPVHSGHPTLPSPDTQCTTSPPARTTALSGGYTNDGGGRLWQWPPSETPPHHMPVDAGAHTPRAPSASSTSTPPSPPAEQWAYTHDKTPVYLRRLEGQLRVEIGRRIFAEKFVQCLLRQLASTSSPSSSEHTVDKPLPQPQGTIDTQPRQAPRGGWIFPKKPL